MVFSLQPFPYKIHQLSVKCQAFTEMLNTKAGKKLFTVSREHSTFASYVKGSNSSYLFMQVYVGRCECRLWRNAPLRSHDSNKEVLCKNDLLQFHTSVAACMKCDSILYCQNANDIMSHICIHYTV